MEKGTDMARFFTGDLHLGSSWATRLRRSTSVAEHDAWLARRWDAKVEADDEVWIAGDLIGEMGQEELHRWLEARPGKKHLILGCNDVDRDFFDLPLEEVSRTATIRLTNGNLMHIAHRPDALPLQGAAVLMHSHTHQREKGSYRSNEDRHGDGESSPGDGLGNALADVRVHIGWEAWRTYVSEPALIDHINTLRHSGRVHHGLITL